MSIAKLTIQDQVTDQNAESIARRVGECITLALFNGNSGPVLQNLKIAKYKEVRGVECDYGFELWSKQIRGGREKEIPIGEVYLKANGVGCEARICITEDPFSRYNPELVKLLFHFYTRDRLEH